MKTPQRAEVWLVDFGIAGKIRPCVVLNIALTDQDRALLTVIPQTTSIRGTRFEVQVPLKFLKENGAFDAQNVATLSLSKFLRRLGTLNDSEMNLVEDIVVRWLGLKTVE